MSGSWLRDSLGRAVVMLLSSVYDHKPPTRLLRSNNVALNPSSRKVLSIEMPVEPKFQHQQTSQRKSRVGVSILTSADDGYCRWVSLDLVHHSFEECCERWDTKEISKADEAIDMKLVSNETYMAARKSTDR